MNAAVNVRKPRASPGERAVRPLRYDLRRGSDDAGVPRRAHRGRRRRRRRARVARQRPPAAPRPRVEEPVVPPGVATVLSVLRSSAVVVDDGDAVAQGLRAGVRPRAGARHRAGLRGARRPGPPGPPRRPDPRDRAADVAARRCPPRHVTARVAPLGSRLVLALVEDRTRERRVEAVRRDFVANVSHELKTPVGAIRLLAEAVADAAEDPEAVKRFAGRMLTESDRLSRLVQQVIELSRLQGDDPLEAPMRGARRRRDRASPSTPARSTPTPSGSRSSPAARRASRCSATRSRSPPRSPTWSPTPSSYSELRLHRAGHHQGRRRRRSRSRSSTRASASRRTRSTGSSSASTGSTRPGTAPPAAPGSASPSSSTSRPRTAATSGCGPSRARGRRSP